MKKQTLLKISLGLVATLIATSYANAAIDRVGNCSGVAKVYNDDRQVYEAKTSIEGNILTIRLTGDANTYTGYYKIETRVSMKMPYTGFERIIGEYKSGNMPIGFDSKYADLIAPTGYVRTAYGQLTFKNTLHANSHAGVPLLGCDVK